MTIVFKILKLSNPLCFGSRRFNATAESGFMYSFRTHADISTLKNTSVEKFKEQQIEISTCGEIYKKWRKEKLHWRAPLNDLNFKVSYVDTSIHQNSMETLRKSLRTVLVLHGAPGSYEDFSILTSCLHRQGIRVIVPSFPDFSSYKPGVFRHSAEEKSQFLKDFLKAINVNKLDQIICHSSAVYPSLRLCVENDVPEVKSLVMLNPGSYSFKMRCVQPYPFIYTFVRLSEFSLGLKIVKLLGPLGLKTMKTPVRIENILDPILSATTMCFANFSKAKEHLQILTHKKFPILFMFADNDKLMNGYLSHEMASLLGAKESDIFYYNGDGILTHPGEEKESLKVMAFEKGSHYVFWKHPEIVNEAVSSFLFKHS